MRQQEGSNETFTGADDLDVDDELDDTSETVSMLGKLGGALVDTGGKHFDGWKPKYRVPCQSVTVEHQHKRSVHLLIQVQNLKQEREIIFDSLDDANIFCSSLLEQRALEAVRSRARLLAALGDIKLQPYEKGTLLVEIVSGWDLPIGDLTTSDPYVECMLGRKEVHKTKHISST